MKKNIIEVEKLKKTFETSIKKKGEFRKTKFDFVAVDNISFSITEGEIIGFIGPNGAGKSTTIKILTGILHPTSGKASVASYTPWKNRIEMSYKIATMFGQKSSLLPHLKVMDSYYLLGAIYDIKKDVLEERINEITEFFDIKHLMSKRSRELSLGQRMICEIASAVLHRPDIIFLDEPTIGLDIVVKKKVRDLIFMLNKKYNTTIFITSHDISDIEELCSRIILINHGKIMIDEKMSEIKEHYLTRKVVSAYISKEASEDAILGVFQDKFFNVSFEKGFVEIEFDTSTKKVHEVIHMLSTITEIYDLRVGGTSLENVIYDVYTNKKEGL